MNSSLSIAQLKPLVICRGPVRLEALEVFAEQGISQMGMLLSKKDAYAAPYALAPELRALPQGCQVHPIAEYQPVNQSKTVFIQSLINICHSHGYNSVFAGYGFLAEDAVLAQMLTAADLLFIGPSAKVSQQAGAKDTAKGVAEAVGAKIVPGDQLILGQAAVLQYQQAPQTVAAAQQWIEQALSDERLDLNPDFLIDATVTSARALWQQHPEFDLRLKAIYGGGGKGQRVLQAQERFDSVILRQQVSQALTSIWTEINANRPFANRNCVLELNIPLTRHWEIQLIGNGQWCVALGGRDCSIQRFEQKLVEISLTTDSLVSQQDQTTLVELEADAVAFGLAVGLDSVSTYESIVTFGDSQRHYFMEMNTRLQVEHRVTELIYDVAFTTDETDAPLVVTSLIHLMCLLALHGPDLPKPTRVAKAAAAVEVRINAMNNALKPSVGGLLHAWSRPIEGEIRDDQGLSRPNPDSGMPMSYKLYGAYDANLALSLVTGPSLQVAYQKMSQVLDAMQWRGTNLDTNIAVLQGIVAVLQYDQHQALSTQWILGYLDLAASVQEALSQPWMSFNPHQVIAWYLSTLSTQQALVTFTKVPNQLCEDQLDCVRQIGERLIKNIHTQQGLLIAPKPSKTADQVLDPPLKLDDALIRAPSGGVYFAQPAPDQAAFVVPGQPIRRGETLCVIEVMKMFNPVIAPFDLIVDEILIINGAALQKGQVLMSFQQI